MRVEGSKVCRMEEEYVQKMNKQCRGKEGNLFKGRNKNVARREKRMRLKRRLKTEVKKGRESAEERKTNKVN